MLSNIKSYIVGKEVVFLLMIIMSILGLIGNVVLNINKHSLLLNVIYMITISILVLITILFRFYKIKTTALYIFATSIIILSILTAQVLISSNPNFSEIIEKHLLTNILYIMITVIISGFLTSFKVSLSQFLVLIVFLIVRPLQVNMPYISENLLSILPLIIGLFIGISFFIKNLEFFIFKVNIQNRKLEIENKAILDNIQYAKRIQNTILPDNDKLNKYFDDYSVFVKRKNIVSNHFYFVEQKNNKTYFAVVNCLESSVSGALMTVVVNFILNKAIKDLELTSPSEIIKYLKNFLSTKMSDIEDKTESVKITLCVLSENKLTYSIDRNYLWISRDSDIKELEDNLKDKIDLHINLEKNDIIYLFSSGGIEQFGF